MMKAAAPMIGGSICPPVEATASTAPASSARYPHRRERESDEQVAPAELEDRGSEQDESHHRRHDHGQGGAQHGVRVEDHVGNQLFRRNRTALQESAELAGGQSVEEERGQQDDHGPPGVAARRFGHQADQHAGHREVDRIVQVAAAHDVLVAQDDVAAQAKRQEHEGGIDRGYLGAPGTAPVLAVDRGGQQDIGDGQPDHRQRNLLLPQQDAEPVVQEVRKVDDSKDWKRPAQNGRKSQEHRYVACSEWRSAGGLRQTAAISPGSAARCSSAPSPGSRRPSS
jgi:hypothetical protein